MEQPATTTMSTRAVVEFVQRHRPQALPQLLEGLHETLGVGPDEARAFLTGSRQQAPASVLMEMLRRLRQDIMADEQISYRMGFEMVALHRWDPMRGFLLRLLGSPQRAARLANWLSRRFSIMLGAIEVTDLTETGCRVSLTFNPSVQLSRDICQVFMGGVAALPLSWGGGPVVITEEACFFQGDPQCRYAVSWSPFTWRDRLATWLRLLPSQRQRFLVHSLEDHVNSVYDLNSRLQRAQASYRAMVAAAADALVEILPDGRLRALNQAALDIVGLKADSPQVNFRDLIHPEDLALVADRHRRRLAGENPPQRYRFRIRHRPGQFMPVEASFSLLQDSVAGKIIMGILRDVTQEEALTQALQDERARFQRLSEFSPFGLAIVDSHGSYQYLNPAFTQIFGYSLNDFQTGAQWTRLAFPDRGRRQMVLATWVADLEALGRGVLRQRTFTATCKDGSRKEILFRPVALDSGENIITYEDVTARLSAQRALSESESRLRTLVEGSPDAILLLDTRQRILKANQEAKALLGENLAGRDLMEAVPARTAPQVVRLWDQALAQGKANMEIEFPPGPLQDHASLLVIEATAVSLGAGLMHLNLRDISDRARLETQRREAARLAGVLELAGTAAHELNQPLMALQGAVELMGLYRDPQNLHRLADQAAGEVQRLADLVGSFSRIVRYETKEYLGGSRIIDLSRAVEKTPVPDQGPTPSPGHPNKTG